MADVGLPEVVVYGGFSQKVLHLGRKFHARKGSFVPVCEILYLAGVNKVVPFLGAKFHHYVVTKQPTYIIAYTISYLGKYLSEKPTPELR
jgi:hypothetical protein